MRLLRTVTTRLLRNKTYGFLNIAGLTIGITCAGLIFLWIGDELSFDQGNKHFNTIYSVLVNTSGGDYNFTLGSTPRPMAAAMKTDIPGVAAAARASDNGVRMLFTVAGKPMNATGLYADPDVFNIFTIPFTQGNARHPFPQLYSIVLTERSAVRLAAGRDFSGTSADSADVIVNQTFADLIDKKGVIGRTIQSHRNMSGATYKEMRIVGVVNDDVYGNIYGSPGPVAFFSKVTTDDWCNLVYVRIRDQQNSHQTLAAIGAVIAKNNPSYPFQYKFVDDQFNSLFADEVQMSQISGIFAGLAILISCLGLFSLAAYTAERRIKEIGIRKVLGATVTGVAALLSKDFLKLTGLACLVAFPMAYWIMDGWLRNYEYRVGIHWWIFALAGATAMLLSILTVSFQAIRAALANPVDSLRSE